MAKKNLTVEILDSGLLVKGAETNLEALEFAHEQRLLPLTLNISVHGGYWRKVPGQWSSFRLHAVGAGATLTGAFQGHLIQYDTRQLILDVNRQLPPVGYGEEYEAALRQAVATLNG